MNEQEIVRLYTKEKKTLRFIARLFSTDHHTIARRLEKHNIEIDSSRRSTEPFTEEHKRKIGEASKGRQCWNKGKKSTRLSRYKNMRAHLRFDVSLDWLLQFEDIDKLMILNRVLSKRRNSAGLSMAGYIEFINKFYFDEQFNAIYSKWLEKGKQKYFKPSLDHIVPRSKGGSTKIDNLQFLTWFENRCKNDMSMLEWEEMKRNITDYFI